MPPTRQKPFDLTASKLKGFDDYDALARWIVEELHAAEDARTDVAANLDYWHRIYEQDRTRIETHSPTPFGADLTTPLGTQYVDALHARTMQTLFVEPIWTVEGWEDSADRAPFVEEFHQWTAEDERLQTYVDRAVQNCWIDSVGILECFEEIDYQPIRKKIWAQIETVPDEMGQPRAVFNEDNTPRLVQDEQGNYVEVPPPVSGQPITTAVAEVEIDSYEPVRLGPGYAVIDEADFYVLPGHARDRRDIWGYAKKFYRRATYLEQKAKDGIYDKKAVDTLGTDNEREQTLDDERQDRVIASQEQRTAEKELYEVALLLDLDGKGDRWWTATVSGTHQKLLRLKYDDLGTQLGFGRFVRFVPLPRKNSVGGLSLVGHKLITLCEEHTAIRNMRADLAALHASAPVKVKQGALFDPEENPIGPNSVIYIRDDMNEVDIMQFPDLSAPLNNWEASVFDAAERTMGVNDISSGITPGTHRTATERQLSAGYSEVRINLVVKRLQESMEELAQIRHIIWKRTLASRGEYELPQSIVSGIEARGVDVQSLNGGRITPDLLEGKFKFKPRGSVETADLGRLRQDFVQMLQTLTAVMQVSPGIAAPWQTPQAAQALNEQIVNLFRFMDRQAILGPAGQQAGQTANLLADPRIQQLLGGGGQMPPQGVPQGGPGMAGQPPTQAPSPPQPGGALMGGA